MKSVVNILFVFLLFFLVKIKSRKVDLHNVPFVHPFDNDILLEKESKLDPFGFPLNYYKYSRK